MFHTEFKVALIIICTTKKICLSLLSSEDANKDNQPRWENKETAQSCHLTLPFLQEKTEQLQKSESGPVNIN